MQKAIEEGAKINTISESGNFALHSAIAQGDNLAISYLFENGALVNTEIKNSWLAGTPLHIAAFYTKFIKNYWVIHYLLQNGAFVSARNDIGITPLHYAARFNNLEAAEILLNANAKVMPRDNEGKTPLDYAESGEMIILLKSYGAKEQ